MPNYEYHCTDCKKQLEIFQKITDESLVKCPECNQSTLRRGPGGGIGLSFKGSGFYITDYPQSGRQPTGQEDKSKSAGCCPCGKNQGCSS